MQVTILIHGRGLLSTSAYHRLGLILELTAYASALGLDVDEDYVVLGRHWVWLTTHLYLDSAIAQVGHHGNVLLAACIHRVGDEFLHLLTAANHVYTRVHDLLDHIAAVAALVKFCCHK